MPRPKGSVDINNGRFIIPNQFGHQENDVLRVWNILNVAANLIPIGGDDLALRYMDVNIRQSDKELAERLAPLIQRSRHCFYGLRKGDTTRDNVGVVLRCVGVV